MGKKSGLGSHDLSLMNSAVELEASAQSVSGRGCWDEVGVKN